MVLKGHFPPNLRRSLRHYSVNWIADVVNYKERGMKITPLSSELVLMEGLKLKNNYYGSAVIYKSKIIRAIGINMQ